jgi:hypothetical protein
MELEKEENQVIRWREGHQRELDAVGELESKA